MRTQLTGRVRAVIVRVFRVARLPSAALYQLDTRITECRTSDPAACCAHSPTLNDSATVHLIHHNMKLFQLDLLFFKYIGHKM